MDNRKWADGILKRFDASFRHRWEIFDAKLKEHLNPETTWLDVGCGDNAQVEELGFLAKRAVGVDLIRVEDVRLPFVQADVRSLPFKNHAADFISLRFVVEHFENRQTYFDELSRVLNKGGRVLFLTTNIYCPFIFLPRILLPYNVKHWIITRLFKVKDDDIFRTFHKVNSKRAIQRISGFRIVDFQYISDINSARKWIFWIFFFWHVLTRLPGLKFLRTNILVTLQKE